jgi:hypothetical protein
MVVYKLVYIEVLVGVKCIMHRERSRDKLISSENRKQVGSAIDAVKMNDIKKWIPVTIKLWFHDPKTSNIIGLGALTRKPVDESTLILHFIMYDCEEGHNASNLKARHAFRLAS